MTNYWAKGAENGEINSEGIGSAAIGLGSEGARAVSIFPRKAKKFTTFER